MIDNIAYHNNTNYLSGQTLNSNDRQYSLPQQYNHSCVKP